MLTDKGITFSRCFIAVGKSDLRKGVDSLAAMVRLRYGMDPLTRDVLFLFCGVRRDRLKGLLWTGDRFILLYIRLADGTFQWPRTGEEARQLSGEEFMRLMDGFSIDPSVGKKRSSPQPKEISQIRKEGQIKASDILKKL